MQSRMGQDIHILAQLPSLGTPGTVMLLANIELLVFFKVEALYSIDFDKKICLHGLGLWSFSYYYVFL